MTPTRESQSSSSETSTSGGVGTPGHTPQDWIAELEPAFRNPEIVAVGFYTFSGTLTATVTRSEYIAARALKLVAPGTGETPHPPTWQPIATAPSMRTILLFAVTDVFDDGAVKNWTMGTGWFWIGIGESAWKWQCEHQPTHWMPLPDPPVAGVVPPHASHPPAEVK